MKTRRLNKTLTSFGFGLGGVFVTSQGGCHCPSLCSLRTVHLTVGVGGTWISHMRTSTDVPQARQQMDGLAGGLPEAVSPVNFLNNTLWW